MRSGAAGGTTAIGLFHYDDRDVNLLGEEVVRVYRSSNRAAPTVHRRGQMAEAEPAVPGWRMPVDDLFPPDASEE